MARPRRRCGGSSSITRGSASADKRGGPDVQKVPLELAFNLPIDLRVDFVRVDEAITALAAVAPEKARVVELRYFGGLSIQDTADVMEHCSRDRQAALDVRARLAVPAP